MEMVVLAVMMTVILRMTGMGMRRRMVPPCLLHGVIVIYGKGLCALLSHPFTQHSLILAQ